MRLIDLAGQRYGRLIVKERDLTRKGKGKWICVCDCGKEKSVFATNLRRGFTNSCGCIWREKINQPWKHGLTGTRIYHIYQGMISRCHRINESTAFYHRYRGRGIKVCDEWLADINSFYSWAMANGYNESLTIDRINNNGDYEPSNCRWIPLEDQSRNTCSNHKITFQDETMIMSDWAREKGLNVSTLHARLKNGWSEEEALTIPRLDHSQSGMSRHYAIY